MQRWKEGQKWNFKNNPGDYKFLEQFRETDRPAGFLGDTHSVIGIPVGTFISTTKAVWCKYAKLHCISHRLESFHNNATENEADLILGYSSSKFVKHGLASYDWR